MSLTLSTDDNARASLDLEERTLTFEWNDEEEEPVVGMTLTWPLDMIIDLLKLAGYEVKAS